MRKIFIPVFKSPSEKLSQMCMKTKDGDLENLVMKFEPEEFLIDTRKVSGSGNGKNYMNLLKGSAYQAFARLYEIHVLISWK